ncbi:MAG: PilZ domain-containing protein [bacterium]|nr:PilZ domain-containing protein [bacterium]
MRNSTTKVFGQRQVTQIVKTPLKAVSRENTKRKSIEDLKAANADRRKYRRIKVQLSGRFMREDQQEYPCYTNDISAGGMNVSASIKCESGEYVVFYIEEIGRIKGFVVRTHNDGFAIAIEASSHKRERLVATLTWLLNRHELQDPRARRHERQIPSKPKTTLVRADGRQLPVEVLDLSMGGARVRVKALLKTGEKVYLGKSSGYVVRVDEDSIGIQFDTEQLPKSMHSFFASNKAN